MSANFDDNVSVRVTTDSAPVGRAGFGTPLILDAAAMPERVRVYTTAKAARDDAAAGMITQAQADAVGLALSQRLRPRRVAVGRLGTLTPQASTVTVGGTATAGVYSFNVGGVLVSFTADGSDTNSDIAAGLRASAATALPGYTIAGTAAVVSITGPIGQAFDVSALTAPDPGTLTLATTPGVTMASEMDEIIAENSEWYGFSTINKTTTYILAAAAWAESAARLYIGQTSDSAVLATGSADIASQLKALGYNSTGLLWYGDDSIQAGVAWMANRLSVDIDARATVWNNVTLVGVPVSQGISETQKGIALGKNANLYLTMGGVGSVGQGVTAGGLNIDETTTIHWVTARVREGISQLLLSESNRGSKVPYTEEGFTQIGAVISAVLQRGVSAGHFTVSSEGNPPFVVLPRMADVDPADRQARRLRVEFFALLAGAIREVSVVGYLTTSDATFEGFVASVEV